MNWCGLLWNALRRTPKGWDEPVTCEEAARLGFAQHQYTESVGGGWAWFWNPEDARRASPNGRIRQIV